jgi:hypothetical protein
MKNIIFFTLVTVIGISPLFSQEETWFSKGFEFGNSIERTNSGTTYIAAPGFILNAYSFYNKKDFGWFIHYSFLFPTFTSGDGNIRDYELQWEFIIGPGFRHSFNENLKFRCGAGIDWMPIFATYNEKIYGDSVDFSKLASNIGVGADAGIKFDITDFLYINGGLRVSYMFYNYTLISSEQRVSNDETTRRQIYDGSINGYGMFAIKPYIGIGYNSYQEKAKRGKPKSD